MVKNRLGLLLFVAVVLLVGCQQAREADAITPRVQISQVENLEEYLSTNVGISSHGKKVFCAYEPLEAAQGKERKIYLWVLCMEYYPEQGSLARGSGVSLPVALQTQEKDGHYEITGHRIPRDGKYYGPDVRDIFPRSAWSQIMPQTQEERRHYNERARRLEKETEMQARSHYGIGTP